MRQSFIAGRLTSTSTLRVLFAPTGTYCLHWNCVENVRIVASNASSSFFVSAAESSIIHRGNLVGTGLFSFDWSEPFSSTRLVDSAQRNDEIPFDFDFDWEVDLEAQYVQQIQQQQQQRQQQQVRIPTRILCFPNKSISLQY